MRHKVESYRTLELACRTQAALTMTPNAKAVLETMALEYKRSAEFLERQWLETNNQSGTT